MDDKDKAIQSLIGICTAIAGWLADGKQDFPLLSPDNDQDRRAMASIIRHELLHIRFATKYFK